MTTIQVPSDVYTVIVTIDTEPEWMVDLERHARLGLEAFSGLTGFISGAQIIESGRAGMVIKTFSVLATADATAGTDNHVYRPGQGKGGCPVRCLKFNGGSVHDYATIADDSPRPSRASRARRAATNAGIS